jgi:hypothetical protein
MGANHGRFDVIMAQEFLRRPNVIAPFEQMRHE